MFIINLLFEKNLEFVKMLFFDLVNRLILYVIKGKYFKNNSVVENVILDIEIDGLIFICVMN